MSTYLEKVLYEQIDRSIVTREFSPDDNSSDENINYRKMHPYLKIEEFGNTKIQEFEIYQENTSFAELKIMMHNFFDIFEFQKNIIISVEKDNDYIIFKVFKQTSFPLKFNQTNNTITYVIRDDERKIKPNEPPKDNISDLDAQRDAQRDVQRDTQRDAQRDAQREAELFRREAELEERENKIITQVQEQINQKFDELQSKINNSDLIQKKFDELQAEFRSFISSKKNPSTKKVVKSASVSIKPRRSPRLKRSNMFF